MRVVWRSTRRAHRPESLRLLDAIGGRQERVFVTGTMRSKWRVASPCSELGGNRGYAKAQQKQMMKREHNRLSHRHASPIDASQGM